MSVFEAIMNRKSIRVYKNDPIPQEVLIRVLEAARWAPSGKNLQPWKFIVVRDKDLREKLATASAQQHFMAEAPVIVVACGYPDECYARMGRYMKSWSVDVAIALEHLILQAQEEGLGTCWIGGFSQENARKIVDIPDKYKVVTVMPIGYPVEETAPRPRKPIEEVVCYEKFAE